jgi:hypothetical protein
MKIRRKEKAFMLMALFVGEGCNSRFDPAFVEESLDFSCHISHQGSKAEADKDLFGYDVGTYLNRFRRHLANSVDCGLAALRS